MTQIRGDGISYDNSMVTVNQTSDEDSSFRQISTASANVSVTQSLGDLFVLPGVALKASAECSFNKSMLRNAVLGGDLIPGMGNIVVSASSGNNAEGEAKQTANANVRANISSNMKGGALNINASSSSSSCSSSSGKSEKSERQKNKPGVKSPPSWVNHGCRTSMDNLNTTKDSNKGCAQSSVNISQNNGSQCGNFKISAKAVADTTQGEPSCSSNAEVILRADQARSSKGQNSSWQNSPSPNVFQKKFAKISLGYLTKNIYAPLLQKLPVKVTKVLFK